MEKARLLFGSVAQYLRRRLRVLDPVLVCCSSLLSLISLMTLVGGRDKFGWKCILMQSAATLVGFVLMVVLANLPYTVLAEKLSPFLFAGSAALLALLLVMGTGAGTNKSWLYFRFLPFGIQPSEFVKSALAITFAYHLSRVRGRLNRPRTVLFLGLHAGAIIGLILLTGDLGVAVVFAGFILLMLFCAGLSLWYFGGGLILTLCAFPLVWNHLAQYQQKRITVGFHPELDPTGYGYQPLLSRDAIMSGGFVGEGMFGGEIYRVLPASHTDFIFATTCEKFGFLGGVIVLGTILVFILRTLMIAGRCDRDYGSYLCLGLAGCLIVQTIENIGMCFGLLPVVGITLPFMSYGGSSILAIYLMAGLVHSVHAHHGHLTQEWQ